MHLMQSPPCPNAIVDGRSYLYFCGTGYLGLHGHPDLIQAANVAMQKYGLGTATSRLGYGSAPPTVAVEELAASFWESEAAFYFASGYLGNHVVLSVLTKSANIVLLDESSHYSVEDACRFFDLPIYRFKHRDPQTLQEILIKHLQPGQVPIVLSDGVFASSGAIAPVPEYVEILQAYDGAMLCLDDCHAFGVLGKQGRGTYEYFGIPLHRINNLPDNEGETNLPGLFSVGTLSKAFGGYGGIVCGTQAFIEAAKNSSHYYSGASAPPIPVAAASAAALRMVSSTPELVTRVQRNALQLKRGLKALGLKVDDTSVPIVCLELGDAQNMRRIQQGLADEGILVAYKAAYSGLGASGALRIALFATHTDEMIRNLTEAIGRQL